MKIKAFYTRLYKRPYLLTALNMELLIVQITESYQCTSLMTCKDINPRPLPCQSELSTIDNFKYVR
jgi:hypothetical protein